MSKKFVKLKKAPKKDSSSSDQDTKSLSRSRSGSESESPPTPTSQGMFGDMFTTPTTNPTFTFVAPERDTKTEITHHQKESLHTGKYTDFVVKIGEKTYPVHKVILSQGKHFNLSGDTQTLLDIDNDSWAEISNYLYTGECSVNEKNYMKLLKASDVLGIEHLLNSCFEWIVKVKCTTDNVCSLLMDAKSGTYGKINIDGLVEKSQAFISREAEEVFKSKAFLDLDLDLIQKFTQADTLSIDELDLYKSLVVWAKHRSLKDTTKSQKELLESVLKNVRLIGIDASDLIAKVKKDGHISYDRILEALEAIIAPECFKMGTTQDLTSRSGSSVKWAIKTNGTYANLFKFSNKDLTVSKIGGGNQWNNAMLYGTKSLKGKSYFEFKINNVNGDKSGYAIGLTKSTTANTQYSGDLVIGLSGYAYNLIGGNSITVDKDDRVGMLVDIPKGKCYFFKNGAQMTCHGVLQKGTEYWPCVHLYYTNDSFTVTFPTKIPKVTNP
jgi:hypothetical protein